MPSVAVFLSTIIAWPNQWHAYFLVFTGLLRNNQVSAVLHNWISVAEVEKPKDGKEDC